MNQPGRSSGVEENVTKIPLMVHADAVSTINECQLENVQSLCIFDIAAKLEHSEEYDIGGVYSDTKPEFWFYFTTADCPGPNYLFSLYVCCRSSCNFSIDIGYSKEFIHAIFSESETETHLPKKFLHKSFKSAAPDQIYFINTMCFNKKEFQELKRSTLFIPIKISMTLKQYINQEIINSIKMSHDYGNLLITKDKSDFILESSSKKQYKVHKCILAAHSPVLRKILNNSNSYKIDIDDSLMEGFLQFLYTGHIDNIVTYDFPKLVEIGNKFEVNTLTSLAEKLL